MRQLRVIEWLDRCQTGLGTSRVAVGGVPIYKLKKYAINPFASDQVAEIHFMLRKMQDRRDDHCLVFMCDRFQELIVTVKQGKH